MTLTKHLGRVAVCQPVSFCYSTSVKRVFFVDRKEELRKKRYRAIEEIKQQEEILKSLRDDLKSHEKMIEGLLRDREFITKRIIATEKVVIQGLKRDIEQLTKEVDNTDDINAGHVVGENDATFTLRDWKVAMGVIYFVGITIVMPVVFLRE